MNASNPTNIFQNNAPLYWQHNLPAIPLVRNEKRPAIPSWQDLARRQPAENEKADWLNTFADGNIGLTMGPASGLVAVDIDTDDPVVIGILDRVLPPSPWHRVGAKGMVRIFRFSGERTTRIQASNGMICEILSSGTQIVLPPSIHPSTGRPYTANANLYDVLDKIAKLPAGIAELIRDELIKAGYDVGKSSNSNKVGNLVAVGPQVRPQKNHSASSDKKLGNGRSMTVGCNFLSSAWQRAENLSYSEWLGCAGIYNHADGGEEIFHELSAKDPRYNEKEASDLFAGVNGPITCAFIDGFDGGRYCKDCALSSNPHFKTPVQLGEVSPTMANVLGSQIYSNQRMLFINIRNGTEYTKANFNDAMAKYFKSPSQDFLSNKMLTQAHTSVYLPGVSDLFVYDEVGHLLYNLWRPGGLKPEDGACDIVLDHVAYQIPEPAEREHFLNVLAHAVQFPGIKVRHAIMLVGGQGTGKSWFLQMVKGLFGEKNVVTIDNDTMNSTFNARMGDKQVAIMEEVGQEDRAEAYNRLKTWLTEETVWVEEKFQPRFEVSTPRVFLAFTNRDLPIKVEADDRRFMFIASPKTPRSDAYYKRLFTDGLSQAGTFLKFLMERDVTNFSPHARPPSTALKQEIVAKSKPAVEREIANMIAEGGYPFDQEVFTLRSVEQELVGRVDNRANKSLTAIAAALKQNGYRQVEVGQFRYQGRHVRLWAKEGSKPITASAEELRELLLRSPHLDI